MFYASTLYLQIIKLWSSKPWAHDHTSDMGSHRSSVVMVSHDDGSTELLTVQDPCSGIISTTDGREASLIGPLEIETLPNTPSPVSSPSEEMMTRPVEAELGVCERAVEDQSVPDSPASTVSRSQCPHGLTENSAHLESEVDQVWPALECKVLIRKLSMCCDKHLQTLYLGNPSTHCVRN